MPESQKTKQDAQFVLNWSSAERKGFVEKALEFVPITSTLITGKDMVVHFKDGNYLKGGEYVGHTLVSAGFDALTILSFGSLSGESAAAKQAIRFSIKDAGKWLAARFGRQAAKEAGKEAVEQTAKVAVVEGAEVAAEQATKKPLIVKAFDAVKEEATGTIKYVKKSRAERKALRGQKLAAEAERKAAETAQATAQAAQVPAKQAAKKPSAFIKDGTKRLASTLMETGKAIDQAVPPVVGFPLKSLNWLTYGTVQAGGMFSYGVVQAGERIAYGFGKAGSGIGKGLKAAGKASGSYLKGEGSKIAEWDLVRPTFYQGIAKPTGSYIVSEGAALWEKAKAKNAAADTTTVIPADENIRDKKEQPTDTTKVTVPTDTSKVVPKDTLQYLKSDSLQATSPFPADKPKTLATRRPAAQQQVSKPDEEAVQRWQGIPRSGWTKSAQQAAAAIDKHPELQPLAMEKIDKAKAGGSDEFGGYRVMKALGEKGISEKSSKEELQTALGSI